MTSHRARRPRNWFGSCRRCGQRAGPFATQDQAANWRLDHRCPAPLPLPR